MVDIGFEKQGSSKVVAVSKDQAPSKKQN